MSCYRRVLLREWPTRDGEKLTTQELLNEGYRVTGETDEGWLADVACRCHQESDECSHPWGETLGEGDTHPQGRSRYDGEPDHRFAGEP